MAKSSSSGLTRRTLLASAASAGLATGVGRTAAATPSGEVWDGEFDVICVGAGAAALTAAVTASHAGARVVVLEKARAPGGTTVKSGAVFWIPNHFGLKARDIEDRREDCIRYLCRYAFPNHYSPSAAFHGVPEFDYQRIAALWDQGSAAVDFLRESGALRVREWRMWDFDKAAPDYLEHVPENRTPTGRPLAAVDEEGRYCWGYGMIRQMTDFLETRSVPVLTEHAVTDLVTDSAGAVTGVVVRTGDRKLRFRATRGVIFGTGGYAHNEDLINRHQQMFVYGSCARTESQGEFLSLAKGVGAKLGNLQGAWRTAVVLEQALKNRAVATGMFVPPGDSMMLVNRYGQRFVNEHRNYNDRSLSHNTWDAGRAEFPNRFQFMIYDARTAMIVGENGQPSIKPDEDYVVAGGSLEELAANLRTRLQQLGDRLDGYTLDERFEANLVRTVDKFNRAARSGKDGEFGRGEHPYDREWHPVWGAFSHTDEHPENTYPNPTMHPLSDRGPYYAIALAPGVLDTNGGPMTDAQGRVVDDEYRPIPGLYGAGNCICSPTRNAYAGAGGTIGPAITYGYIAARHAVTGMG